MRNIVLIHLESTNWTNFNCNRDFFPFLNGLYECAVSYTNYYSTATSTLMVLSDLAYGEKRINERYRTMGWERTESLEYNSVFDWLKTQGYNVSVIDYPPNGSDAKQMNINHFLGQTIQLEEFDSNKDYHQKIHDTVDDDIPFVLWLCNYISHVEFNSCMDRLESGINRWSKGYKKLDEEIRYLYKLIESKNLIDNTTFIFYGDHGDDIFTHWNHAGLTHAVEPLSLLIHTPFFIIDNRIEKETRDELLCTYDIGDIIRNLIKIDKSFIKCSEVISKRRNYVFARNMFAAQRVKDKSFEKGYSICDGRFLLLVNSKGLSMYEIKMDPTCNHNLLQYFLLEEEMLNLNYDIIEHMHYHFKSIFDVKSLEFIRERFYVLRDNLYIYVKDIYKSGNCLKRLFELDFSIIDFGKNLNLKRDNLGDFISKDKFELFEKYFIDKKIVLYGAGRYGQFCYKNIPQTCHLVAWIDADKKKRKECFIKYQYKVGDLNTIKNVEFDYIYIAVMDGKVMQSIYSELVKYGIDDNRII